MGVSRVYIEEQKVYFYYQVFLVAGGRDPQTSDLLSSTETLVEGSQAWNFQKPLPSGRAGLSGISLLETVLMLGGEKFDQNFIYMDDVLMFDPKSFDWIKIGSLSTVRAYHAASLVNMKDVIEF